MCLLREKKIFGIILFTLFLIQFASAKSLSPNQTKEAFTIHHSPSPADGQYLPDQNYYKWEYRTEVHNHLSIPLKVKSFGIYFQINGEWSLKTFTNHLFSAEEFNKWYIHGDSLENGWILPGKMAAVRSNWHTWGNFISPPVKWVYVVVDSTGNEYHAEAEVLLEPAFVPVMHGSVRYAQFYRYQAGDDTTWAQPDFDDRHWLQKQNPSHYPEADRAGVRWLRSTIEVDSSLWNLPLGLYFQCRGAAEFYIDGKLVHRFGKVGNSAETEMAKTNVWYPRPVVISFSPSASDSGTSRHQLAIRHSSFFLEADKWTTERPDLNFVIGDFEKMSNWYSYVNGKAAFHQAFLMGIFLAFTIIHFLLFFYYPAFRANLHFALLCVTGSIMVFFNFQDRFFAESAAMEISSIQLHNIATSFVLIFVLRFVYEVVYAKRPRQYFIFVALCIGFAIWSWFRPFQPHPGFLVILLVFIEIIRVVIIARIKRQKLHLKGSWVLLIGVGVGIVASIYQILTVDFDVLPRLWVYFEFPTLFYAFLVLMISMSVFLSRNFARTNKALKAKLAEVKKLSEQTLQQELAQARLEADNERKTRELAEARELQLSMLPETVPNVPNLEIAVYMQPATEVGGDYYDFKLEKDGTLTAAIGDATGHGLQAGTIVTATKGVFSAMPHETDLVKILKKSSAAIKSMGFQRLYMAMTIAKFKDNQMQIAGAGMPYALVYRSQNRQVEEIALKGMPLGSFPDFPYQQADIHLQKGDAVLLLSDGLPEMFNEEKEEFGEDAVKNIFSNVAHKTPDEIVQNLVAAGKKWAAGTPQADDVTLMVIKYFDHAAPAERKN